MLSWVAHYKNKYQGGSVAHDEESLDVYDKSGRHCVAVRKNGAGMWVDRSADFGCAHAHDLAPLPQAANHWEHLSAKPGRREMVAPSDKGGDVSQFVRDGKVLSQAEIDA